MIIKMSFRCRRSSVRDYDRSHSELMQHVRDAWSRLLFDRFLSKDAMAGGGGKQRLCRRWDVGFRVD